MNRKDAALASLRCWTRLYRQMTFQKEVTDHQQELEDYAMAQRISARTRSLR